MAGGGLDGSCQQASGNCHTKWSDSLLGGVQGGGIEEKRICGNFWIYVDEGKHMSYSYVCTEDRNENRN